MTVRIDEASSQSMRTIFFIRNTGTKIPHTTLPYHISHSILHTLSIEYNNRQPLIDIISNSVEKKGYEV